jgi:peroxiredoxin
MKQFVILPVIFCYCHLVFSQSDVILTGHIDHPKGKMVYLSRYADVLSYEETIIDSGMVDKKGNFRLSFACETSGPVLFFHGDEYTDLYICPGQKLHLTLDTEAFDETMTHSGDGAVINSFLAANMLEQEKLTMDMYALPEKDFITYMDSMHQAKQARIQALEGQVNNKSSCDGSFVRLQKAEHEYVIPYQLLEYPAIHAYLKREVAPEMSNEKLAFLQNVRIENPEALESDNYRMFLESYVNQKVSQIARQDTTSNFDVVKEEFIRKTFNGPVLEYTYAKMIYELLTYSRMPEKGTAYMEWFLKNFGKSQYIPVLLATQDKAMSLAAGKPAPDISGVDRDGNVIGLNDFKGKFVYLDVWATWCGPCVAEIPGMEKLINQFEAENIAFVSISIDPDQKRWESFIEQKDMHGIQLYSGKNFDSPVVKAYGINGIPRYILIDPSGNIIDANADRPGQIRDKLNELLD